MGRDFYLEIFDLHEDSKASEVVALASDMRAVVGNHLAACTGPVVAARYTSASRI